MVRRNGKSRRQQNQQGAKKQKIIRKVGATDIFQRLENLLPLKYRQILHLFAERCFIFNSKVCCNFCLVPFERDPDGKFIVSTKLTWRRVVHYFILTIQIASLLQKLVVLVERMGAGIMDLTTCLCFVSFLAFFVGYSMPTSLLLKPNVSAQFLNAGPMIMKLMVKDDKSTNIFDNAKISIVAVAAAILVTIIAIVVSLYGFVVDELPCALYYILLTYFGLHPPNYVPAIVWKIFLWPLELLMYSQPMFLALWAGMIIISYPAIGTSCTDQLRQLSMVSEEKWVQLQQEYSPLYIYSIVANIWVKLMIVPSICSVSSAIIVCFYVTIRHTELPHIVYFGFPYVGLTLLVMLFWLAFEALGFIRATEDLVETLNSRTPNFLRLLPLPQKLYIKKAGKAMRPARIDIGMFSQFSIDLPFAIWDEILNQLFFMLSF